MKKFLTRIVVGQLMLGCAVLWFPVWLFTGIDLIQEWRDFVEQLKQENMI